MELFKIIPENFFGLLNLKKKEVYIEALLVIWKKFKECNGVMSKVDCSSALVSHFDNKIFEIVETDEEMKDKDKICFMTCSNAIINTIANYGWIKEEHIPKSLDIHIKIPFYSSRFIETITQIISPSADVTENYALNVYNNIKDISLIRIDDSLLLLENAYNDTRNLMNVLHETFDRMQKYFEDLLDQKSYNNILKEHFQEYAKKIVDTRFHPMLTNRNVLRHRQSIIEKIYALEYEDELLGEMAKKAQERYELKAESEALNKILNMIEYIKESFENVDDVRENLKSIHNQYVSVTNEKLAYLTSRDESLKDNLFKLIQIIENNQERADDISRIIQSKINLNDFGHMGESSLFKQRKNRKKFTPNENNRIDEADITSNEDNIKELLASRKEKSNKTPVYTRENIENFIKSNLDKNGVFDTENLLLDNREDYIKLILSLNYTSKKSFKYKAIVEDKQIETLKYSYPKIIFAKKGDK